MQYYRRRGRGEGGNQFILDISNFVVITSSSESSNKGRALIRTERYSIISGAIILYRVKDRVLNLIQETLNSCLESMLLSAWALA